MTPGKWMEEFRAKGHEPILNDDGDGGGLDLFVTSHGFHNGPGCKKCGWTGCMHCIRSEKIPECPKEGSNRER